MDYKDEKKKNYSKRAEHTYIDVMLCLHLRTICRALNVVTINIALLRTDTCIQLSLRNDFKNRPVEKRRYVFITHTHYIFDVMSNSARSMRVNDNCDFTVYYYYYCFYSFFSDNNVALF